MSKHFEQLSHSIFDQHQSRNILSDYALCFQKENLFIIQNRIKFSDVVEIEVESD